ncbi:GNAT family N-acetyltransferase [Rhodomicrobium vannielii ATCC 17100]|uniref:GNAT family N-acetyltransferase n=1 Tax=Rhodomicrobium vannielii TaxID=1069 RepID=UPI001919C969|nr:GNAT family N-acetyltransferase [Rhodomicrobium vannielii]MBJ7535470.1 GNAT family N-acetyltransferase [Rhodomicrobium vannielii ATCC 17100]
MGANLISFRLASSKDANAVAAIHDAAWRSTYQGIIPHLHLERMIARRGPRWWQQQVERGANVTLLMFDGVPQGYATWGKARGTWPWEAGEIFELYVNPAFQGIGLGTRLFATVKDALKREGLKRLVVWALKDNETACAFYGGLGGFIVAATPERYGDVSLTRVAFAWGVNVKSSKA